MAKLIYGKDFGRLLKACYAAEDSYRSYLIKQFGFKDSLPLTTMLKEAFAINAKGNNTMYYNSTDNLKDMLNQDMTMELYLQLTDKFEKIFTGERLDRTTKALEEMLQAKLSGKKGENLESVMKRQISYIIGNYKEWTFLMRGKQDIDKNSGKNNLFKAELIDVDNLQMDFVIQDVGSKLDTNTYGRGDNRKFKYLSNAVPLEYKSSLKPKFHLLEKKQNESAISPIITRHVEAKNNDWDKMYDNIIVDLTMMAIINKLDEGFPVFVTSEAGTGGRQFLLCSSVLENLQSREGLHSHIIDISFYNTENLKKLSLDDILTIIKNDKDIRASIENDIVNIEDNIDLSEDEKYEKIEQLDKQKAAESIVKKLLGRKSITTNLFYGR